MAAHEDEIIQLETQHASKVRIGYCSFPTIDIYIIPI